MREALDNSEADCADRDQNEAIAVHKTGGAERVCFASMTCFL